MISFIVCSLREDQLGALSENLAASAGVEFELLTHRNRETNWGLARVYNHLAERARFPLLAFLHEDVRFPATPVFGRELVDFYAARPGAGVVGFAGSQVKSRSPSGWENLAAHTRESVVQHGFPEGARVLRVNPEREAYSQVTVLDGLALFVPRQVWSAHRFDEATCPGFHAYDLDFTTQVAQTHANYVCHVVLPEHFSMGSPTASWREACERYHRKWAERLPLACVALTPAQLGECEAFSAYHWLRELLRSPPDDPAALDRAWADYRSHARSSYTLRLLRHRLRAAFHGQRQNGP
jgi:hypothetical protein